MTESVKIGKIVKIMLDKGYGFIISKDIPFERIFFHWSGLANDTLRFPELEKGMEVEFEAQQSDRGWRAIKIYVLEPETTNRKVNNESNKKSVDRDVESIENN